MLLLIDNYDSFTYNLAQALKKLYSGNLVVLRNDALSVDEAKAFDGIIISPGPGLPEEAGISIPLISRFMKEKPILGVCLGHQSIVSALGGNLRQLPLPLHGVDRKIQKVKEDPLWEGITFPMATGRYHSWVADEKSFPEELDILAMGEEGHIAALRHRSFPVYGVQFHPESVLSPDGEKLLHNWLRVAALRQAQGPGIFSGG